MKDLVDIVAIVCVTVIFVTMVMYVTSTPDEYQPPANARPSKIAGEVESYRHLFMQGCAENEQMFAFCECAFNAMSEQLTVEQFLNANESTLKDYINQCA